MILLKAPQALATFMIVCFILSGILIIVHAILWEEERSKQCGDMTWKQWWNYLKKH